MDTELYPEHERRIHHRVPAVMPVDMEVGKGSTVDVSPGGFCLKLDNKLNVSSTYYFEMRLATDDPIFLTGMATVLREELREESHYYGLEIIHSRIKVH
jgi:hypothetical protein